MKSEPDEKIGTASSFAPCREQACLPPFTCLLQMPITSPLPHELHISIAEYAAADAILDSDWPWAADLCLLSRSFLPALAPVLYHTVFVREITLEGVRDHARNRYSWFSLHTRHLVVDTETLSDNAVNGSLTALIMEASHLETITGVGDGLIWVQRARTNMARAIHYDADVKLAGTRPPSNLRNTLLRRLTVSLLLTHLHLRVSNETDNDASWSSFIPDGCSITHLLLDVDVGIVTTMHKFVIEWLRHSRLQRLLVRASHKMMSRAVCSRAFSGEGQPVRFQLLVDSLVLHCKEKDETRIWAEGHPQYELDHGRAKMRDVIAGHELWYRGLQLHISSDNPRPDVAPSRSNTSTIS